MNIFKRHLPITLAILLVFACSTSFAYAQSEPNFMTSIMWSLVTGLFGKITWIGGAILDYGIQHFVVGFGDDFQGSGVGLAVDTLWVTVRDIFNISFIFGLVYIGLKMILNPDDSGSRRWLVYLILAALLINFSLYITKFIVDFSNILATQIATAFIQNGEYNISSTFMDQLGVTSALDGTQTNNILNGKNTPWGYIFGAAITFLVAGFVFAAGGLMLIIRYAVLCLYMVLSPLMFLGWVFPGLQRISSEYWSGFLGRAFFAPMYLLMLYFSMTVLRSFSINNPNPDFANVFGEEGAVAVNDFENTLPPFILTMIFMVASIVIGKKMGAHGAAGAVNIMNNVRGRVQRGVKRTAYAGARVAAAPVTKGAGYAARSASNRAGNLLNKKLDKWQKAGGARGAIAGNVAVAGAVTGAAASMKNRKFGLNNTVDQNDRAASEIKSRVQADKDIKAGHTAQSNPNYQYDREHEIHDPSTGNVVARSSLTGAALTAAEAAEAAHDRAVAAGRDAENNLSQKELEMMMVNDKNTFDKVIGNVNAGTFDKMMDSDNFTPDQKADMLKNRQAAIRATIEENGAVLSENLQNMSIKQIETMGDQFVRDNAHLFSQSQMDEIKKSTKFTEGQKGSYATTRKTNQIKMADDPSTVNQLLGHNSKTSTGAYAKSRKATDIANLPYEVFVRSEEAVKKIDRSVLEEIVNKKTMTAEERAKLRKLIESTPGANTEAVDYMNSPQGIRHWQFN